jgi:DNA-binding transcriptional regulator YiaG
MKCPECGSTMKKTVGDHVYRESGMDHVILRNLTKYTCPEDGRSFIQIPAVGQLHRVLALAIAGKPARLIPSEVRFIRDHLALSNTQFAELMGVTSTQSSRWTNSEAIGPQAELFLRVLATLGPDVVKPATEKPSRTTSETTGMTRAGFAEEALEKLARVIHRLPPPSAEPKTVKIRFRRSGAGWKQDAAMSN